MNQNTNRDPETNLAFGVIGAHVMNSEVVDQLLYGSQITNHSYQLQKAEAVLSARRGAMWECREYTLADEEAAIEEFAERFESDEDYITGTYQGVGYATAWFSGALHFFIMKSPYTKAAAPCSPCCPGAGDLHNEGSLLTYDVPPEWRA